MAQRSKAIGAVRIMQPMQKLTIKNAGRTKPIRRLQYITGFGASVYKQEMKPELLDSAKVALNAIIFLAKMKLSEIHLIDDADWTLFGEVGAKCVQSHGESSDYEMKRRQRLAPAKTKRHQGLT